jgi:hypothetical protein
MVYTVVHTGQAFRMPPLVWPRDTSTSSGAEYCGMAHGQQRGMFNAVLVGRQRIPLAHRSHPMCARQMRQDAWGGASHPRPPGRARRHFSLTHREK